MRAWKHLLLAFPPPRSRWVSWGTRLFPRKAFPIAIRLDLVNALEKYAETDHQSQQELAESEAELKIQSDRGVIILTSMEVENELYAAIRDRMGILSLDEAHKLFENEAPMGTFVSKINVAYALRIIDESGRDDMVTISHMKEACVRSRRVISFATPELAVLFLNIIERDTALPVPDKTQAVLRTQFISKCVLLRHYIRTGVRPADPIEAADLLSALFLQLHSIVYAPDTRPTGA